MCVSKGRGGTYVVQLDSHICHEENKHRNRKEEMVGDVQSGNSAIGFPVFLNRLNMSARLAAVQKLISISESDDGL